MRKFTTFTLIIVLMVSLTVSSVSAASIDTSLVKEVRSSEKSAEPISFSESQLIFDIKIQLLSLGGYHVYTKNMPAGELALINEPRSPEEIDTILDSIGASLIGIGYETNTQLFLTIHDNPSDSYSNMDDGLINSLGELFVRQYENVNNSVVTDWDIYKTKTDTFIKLSSHGLDNSIYSVEYVTVVDNKGITISMQYYDNADSRTCEQQIAAVIDNIQLVNNGENRLQKIFGDSLFIDDDTGLMFFIPEGWSNISEEGAETAFFVPDDYDDTKMIMYSGYDTWEELKKDDPNAEDRSAYNTDGMTEKEAADFLEIDADTVSIEYLGSREYICVRNKAIPGDQGLYGYDFVQYVRIEDARMYLFLFTSNESDKDFLAFQEMIEGAFYP